MNNNLDLAVQKVAVEAAGKRTEAVIQDFLAALKKAVDNYADRATADANAILALTLVRDSLLAAAGMETPLPKPLQKRPGYKVRTPLVESAANTLFLRELRQAQAAGAEVWVHSEQDKQRQEEKQ
jgi:hypothetical protein